MNEKQGRPEPEDREQGRAVQRRPAPPPAHTPQDETAGARTGGNLDPTIGMEQTASYAERTVPTAEPGAAQAAAAAPTAAIKPLGTKEGQVIANRFVVHRMLGQGGMGRVFAVQDRQIEGRDVALKVLLPKYSKNAQFRKLFFQEVRAAQEFVSEYICQVRDTGETEDGSLFFTMDMVEGESLRSLLDREKLLGARHALEITRQVLLGLQSGHEKGFVHRDIKPSNVMLAARVPKTDTNPYGVGVRLLDFGIAGLATEIDERSRAGTVMYMSPEQASGERLDPRSDLFAVGVLLFETLSGHRPFDGSTTRALVQSVLETNLTARLGEIPNLPKSLRKLLERALQKDRNKRFQSADEFAQAIAGSAAYRLPKEVPVWMYASVAIAVAATGAMGYFYFDRAGTIHALETRLGNSGAERAIELQNLERTKNAELLNLERAKNTEIETLRGQNATLNLDIAGARQREGDAVTARDAAEDDSSTKQNQINTLEGQLNGIREERKSLAESVNNLESDFRKLESENAELKEKLAKADLQASGNGRLASAFDTLAGLMDRGQGEIAEASFQDLEKKGVFADFTGQLQPFLRAMVGASAHIERHTRSIALGNGPRLGEIRTAQDLLEAASREFTALEVGPLDWSTVALGAQVAPNRIEQGGKLLARLKGQAQAQMVASESEDTDSWKTLALDRAAKDPKPIFDHFDRYGCKEHLGLAASRVVATLDTSAVSGPSLALDALNAFALADWVARLQKEQFKLSTEEAQKLRLYEFAQRWYGKGDASAPPDWNFARLAVATAATSDWRQIMFLQWQLSHPSSNFLIKLRRSQLYLRTEPNKAVEWERYTQKGDSRFVSEKQSFYEEGLQKGTAEQRAFQFADGVLRAANSDFVILDLHACEPGLSVAPFPAPNESVRVPGTLASDAELRAFRNNLKSRPQACLVVKEAGRERWYSPEFGLVRDDREGTWRLDLVSATGVQ